MLLNILAAIAGKDYEHGSRCAKLESRHALPAVAHP
jgi:hypothetical protein